ncbi:spore gernimation protein KB [Bacillus mycoides]|nr:spore gernimation protein KB [Bacillus mycoides]
MEIMTEQKEQQESKKQKHMFPSLLENINYIENKLSHSDDIKKLDLPFQNGKGTILYIESLADPMPINLRTKTK